MKKIIIAIPVVMLLASFALVYVINSNNKTEVESSKKTSNVIENNEIGAKDLAPNLTIGSPSAKVEIIEYADFKCPTCNRFLQNTGKEIRERYIKTGQVKIVFRNLPFISDDSRTAAEGSYCANEQNKFVDYHDLLFNTINQDYYSKGKINQGEASDIFSQTNLTELVTKINIDPNKFDQCLSQGKFKAAVQSDLNRSQQDGATGTPTFIVAGQKVVGSQSFDIFEKLIKIGVVN